MEYVRSEFGPHAKIVAAERVRQGGFAGFFAKESYELTVDVPAVPGTTQAALRLRSHRPPPPAAVPVAPKALPTQASSIEDLLDAADASDTAMTRAPSPDSVRAREEIVASPQAAAQAATPRAATGGAQFATVLDQVRALAAEGVSVDAVAAQLTATQPAAPDGTSARASETGAAVAGEVAAEPPEPVPETTRPSDAFSPTAAPAVPAGAPASDPFAAQAAPAAAPAPPALDPAELRSALSVIGVPPGLLGAQPLTLSAVLDNIPSAPSMPREAGEILAVVGSSSDLAALEPMLVERMRLTPPDVVHVGLGLRFDSSQSGPDRPTRITSAQALSAWRARAPMARHPWLVLIPVDGDAEARAEVAGLAADTRPTQLWAVVDARTKPTDAERWLNQVGAQHPVDALAVRSLMDTSAPGTVLSLNRPIAWIDGLPTSRVVWAAAFGQPLDSALA